MIKSPKAICAIIESDAPAPTSPSDATDVSPVNGEIRKDDKAIYVAKFDDSLIWSIYEY